MHFYSGPPMHLLSGVDTRPSAPRRKAAARRLQANTFVAVATDFLDQHGSKLAKAVEVERIIKSEFVRRWAARPITEIEKIEVSKAILAIVKRDAPYQARNSFAILRKLFNWAIGQGLYGIETSPLERLSVNELCGKSEARDRTLTDAELRAVWEAAGEMKYPYGDCYKLLILTGQRLKEIAEMSWPEIGDDQATLTIPGRRMKGKVAPDHIVPLGPAARALLASLPRFGGGDFVFSTTAGWKAVNGFSKAKTRIDQLSGVSDWKNHDIRRSMRSHLSALPIQEVVRERMIAHQPRGLAKHYDKYQYMSEKRDGFELWEKRLFAIVNPPPPDVADLAAARARLAS